MFHFLKTSKFGGLAAEARPTTHRRRGQAIMDAGWRTIAGAFSDPNFTLQNCKLETYPSNVEEANQPLQPAQPVPYSSICSLGQQQVAARTKVSNNRVLEPGERSGRPSPPCHDMRDSQESSYIPISTSRQSA
ncbi:hypothetical protein ABW21_db0205802 [Orbilia brochopaga]|nr:hypothetical protein ABW21_db0205802 [Drechslerella brochopaga]